jgi:hypothetical protein
MEVEPRKAMNASAQQPTIRSIGVIGRWEDIDGRMMTP